jgi:hypothetical protein
VLGFLFIFAIIVSLIGINQAFLVPQSNENVEFQHSQEVQSDMIELRGGTIEAASANERRVVSVRLGLQYPNRLIASNPPPVAGTLRTVEPDGDDEISVEGVNMTSVCGTTDQPDTKFLTYEADYNEYQSARPISVENTVAHRQANNSTLLDTNQAIVKGNQIRIIRLIGDYRTTRVTTENVNVIPANRTGVTTSKGTVEPDSCSVTLPTKLGQSDWETLLDDQENVTDVDVSDSTVRIELDGPTPTEEYVVQCTTVGIEEEPDVDPAQSPPFDSDPTTVINPVGPGTIELIEAEASGNDIIATFLNRYDDDRNVTAARIPYVNAPNQAGTIDEVTVEFEDGDEETLDIGADFENVSGGYFEPEGNDSVTRDVTFGGFQPTSNVGFELQLRISDPETGETVTYTYFISVN